MSHGSPPRLAVFVCLGTLLLAGCGGGEEGSSMLSTPAAPVSPPVADCPLGYPTTDIRPGAGATPCESSNYDTHTDVAYAAHDRALLDLLVPRNPGSPPPLAVWIHGGGWQSGDKSNRAQAERLVCRGYAVAALNYRLSDTAAFPAQIHDVKAAIRFLRANAAAYGIDGNRIAAFGSSAGGHLAALAGTSADVADLEDLSLGNAGVSSRVQAVVDWYGPTRFSEMDVQLLAQACPAGSAHHSDADSAESRLLGCTIGDAACASAVRRADPSNYVTAGDPPMLLMHGTADCIVPVAQSTLLSEQLAAAGVCAVQRQVLDAGHGGPAWTSVEAQDAAADFLDRML